MKEKFVDLPERAARAAKDKNMFTHKAFVKVTLGCKLERCLIVFKKAKQETKQQEQQIATLQEQVDSLLAQIDEAQKKKDNISSKQKEMFELSKDLKAELNVVEKRWPEYEAKMRAAEEEEKMRKSLATKAAGKPHSPWTPPTFALGSVVDEIKFIWKIKNFPELELQKLYLEVFSLGDDKWDESHGSSKEISNDEIANGCKVATGNPTEEDINAFFVDLGSEISSSQNLSPKEELKEALTRINDDLNMDPADLNDAGGIYKIRNAFDVLSSLDTYSVLSAEQKELLTMKGKIIDLPERAAKASKDKNLFMHKEFVKMTLHRELGRCLIVFESTKEETEQQERNIATL
ncbi:hypothetical protein SLEP1_g32374 [Rubroshorea leprosula]|uniref:Uncharacterized protein n=1 Tax=Rubroshorea leprosula TaxID=152421 RepID=A0AAV5KD33_9ROSI|nr:hypothetical protein SLEP1_g32374 [Rubroshorea leprosula]